MESKLTLHNGEKSSAISFVRFVAMCFIVLCHVLQYYGNELAWWFNVGVQMFFFVSGFLYGNKNIDAPIDFLKKNFKKILVPYYSFLLPMIVLYSLFAKDVMNFKIVLASLFCAQTIKGLEHLWFISYILFCYLITPYLYFIKKNFQSTTRKFSIFCSILFILVFGQLLFYFFDSYFSFNRIFCYMGGYFASVMLNMYGFKKFKTISNFIIGVSILMNVLRILFKYFFKYEFLKFELFEAYCHALLGSALVLIGIVYCDRIKFSRLFVFSDKYSYYIYIVHQLFILSPFTLLTLTKNMWINLLIMMVAVLLSALVLRWLSIKVENLKVLKI